MKKYFFISFLLCGSLFGLSSCDDSESKDNPQLPNEDNSIVITDIDAQNKLTQTGQAFLGKINAEQLKPTINLLDYMSSIILGEDEYENGYPEPDINVPSESSPLYRLTNDLRAVTSGDFARIATRTMIEDIYSLKEHNGIYTYDDNTNEWDKQLGGNYIEARFNYDGKSCIAKVEYSGNEYNYVMKDSAYNKMETVVIPEEIYITLQEAGSNMVSIQINTIKCNQDTKEYEVNINMEMAESYNIDAEITDTDKAANSNIVFSVNNENLITATVKAEGNRFSDFEDVFDENLEKEDLDNSVISVSILNGQVQYKMSLDNSNGLLNDMDFDGYYHLSEEYDSYLDSTYVISISSKEEALAKAEKAANSANTYFINKLYFDNSTYSTSCKWQPIFYDYGNNIIENEWGTSKWEAGEWDIEPVIEFSNGTTYSMDDYFTDIRFSSLINTYNELISRFE